jgi:hypothetical protein
MSFDETYDEMLHDEFSSRGKHQAKAAAAEPELTEGAARGRHAAAEEAETRTEAAERPRGLQRYRTAGLVGAGGLACAAAGAFLGGLGGYFTISPAAAHPVAAATITQDLPLAQAVGHGAHSSSGARGTSAVTAAEISKVLGSLTNGIAPFASLTSSPFGNHPVNGLPGVGGSGSGKGGRGGGNGTKGGGAGGGGGGLTGCASGSSGLDLNCILSGLTGALTNLGSLTGGNPGTMVSGLVPTLTGVVTDVTGTLQNLTTLLPIASLPLPSGGIPTTLLAGGGPTTGAPATTGGAGSNPVVSALSPVLNTVGSVTGALGSTGPSIPSLPLPTTTGTTVPGVGSSGTTTPTTAPGSGSSGGGPTTVNVPLPVPVPVNTPTITIGGLSVGVSGSGSTSGLTLTLP